VLQVPLISENEHRATFAFVHQKMQQGFQSQPKVGPSLAALIENNQFKKG